ncbi:MAG: type II toxin-antitoxin system VapC family toxin [Bifidobacteriaceae bacterium]|nr:type II toxin-antitoxin system VapC family toxin [Bifidobacteriaceae bacterium]
MTFYLDANTCVEFLRGRSQAVRDRLREQAPRDVRLPAMVKAELLFGAARSRDPQAESAKVKAFLDGFEIEAFGSRAAARYGEIRSALERAGQAIGPNDLIIAATVLAAGGTLVTHNIKEFERVPGLALADWQQ